MRKAIIGLSGLLALLIVVMVGRGLMVGGSKQPAGPVAPIDRAVAMRVARHLAAAVKFQTISTGDSSRTVAALDSLYDWMGSTYPRVFAATTREVFGRSLLFTWKGTDTTAPPLLLMAHMDVVPVESGTESKWTYKPFSGEIADGFVWGRGTLDDKLNVVGELEALDKLITLGFVPRRTVMLAFDENEESFGSGARAIVDTLKARRVHPMMVVDEGTAVVSGGIPAFGRPVALVGIAEKGSVNVELVAESPGGHSSMPPPQTATGIVAAAVARLEEHPMPARLSGGLRTSLSVLAPELNFPSQIALSNMWLGWPFAKRYLERRAETNALIRTTTAATMFDAGVKDNVLPQRARAVVNFRLLPGDSISTVLAHVREVVSDSRISTRVFGTGVEASPISDITSPAYALFARTIRQTMPDAVVVPFVVLAGTDARHFTSVSPNVFRFDPMRLTRPDIARVHGTNERVSIDNLGEVVSFYVALVRNSDKD